jgi:MATE family, multidrug efflux pump
MLRLATPIVVVQVGMMAMGVVDTMMVGHVSAQSLAAVALGNLFVFGSASFAMGVLMALDPVVAQAVGAGDRESVARAVQRGLVLCVALSVPVVIALIVAAPVLFALHQPPEVVPIAAAYARASIAGIVPFLAFVVLRQSLQALGRVAPIVTTIIGANIVHALLNWAMIFGKLGVPALGAVGAGWASSISRWLMAGMLVAWSWRDVRPYLRPWRRETLTAAPLVRMLRLGAPIGGQQLLEVGVFNVVALLMGWLGTVQMAAHQIALNLAALTFMVPLGVSAAASVLVGHSVGANDLARARRMAGAALVCGAGFMSVCAGMFLTIPHRLARAYTTDAAVLELASSLIALAGIFQIFDGLQVVSIGVLRGVGDVRAPMVVNVLGFWLIGLPVSLWLGFHVGAGAEGLWWGLVAGLAVVATFLVARVLWRMRGHISRVVVEEMADAEGDLTAEATRG